MRKAIVIRAGRGIGGALVDELIRESVDVIAISGSQRKLDRLKETYPNATNLITVQGNVQNPDELLVASLGVDVIFCGIYLTYDEKPEAVQEMLKAVEKVSSQTGAKVVVIEGVYRPDRESKMTFSDKHYLRLISPELYGAAASNTIIHYPLKKIAKGKPAKVIGNLSFKREYLYLKDAARYVVELALQASSYGKTWRLRGGPAISTEELLSLAGSAIKSDPHIKRIGGWKLRLLQAYEPGAKAFMELYEREDGESRENSLEYSGNGSVTPYEAGTAETITSMVERYRSQSSKV
ncbi:NAD-dependent epimerase/dehydratase family protein [Paenibacillus sepulcri]|uniref:NAD-dependent epimerase/dehydratase family protein n=1 Tax=Paenibacillus sepulcri TaxID=359917 RepID=A0ABS7BWM9_9BACL|nr:NAD-dependent epimerase/dehydratase family protein [Paenibacillus sepulcri]